MELVESRESNEKEVLAKVAGDTLCTSRIPEPEHPVAPAHIGLPAAKLAGRYLVEGDVDGSTIEISGHARERGLFTELEKIAESYGGSASLEEHGDKIYIDLWGPLLHAVLRQLISGHGAAKKALATCCWSYSNKFLVTLLEEYLRGDGEWDEKNRRWRLGFTRNRRLARDFRVLAARLGLRLVLCPTVAQFGGRRFPSFRGEIRFQPRPYRSCKAHTEIVRIRKRHCRNVFAVSLSEGNQYLTASGIFVLTT